MVLEAFLFLYKKNDKEENMAKVKEIAGRLVLKHDIEVNWNKAESFIPKQGEVIVYDIDENYYYERIKIGDGKTAVTNLPFYLVDEVEDILKKLDSLAQQSLVLDWQNNTLIFK
jgi:hypothetical protein